MINCCQAIKPTAKDFQEMKNMKKRLYRSTREKMLFGVCGGVAEYFETDPTIIRLAWVVFSLLGGSGILAYIIAAIIMPADQEKMP